MHSGNLGDCVYSLATVKAMLGPGEKADYLLQPNVPSPYNSGPHPLKDKRLSREWAERLIPLLAVQPYIRHAGLYAGGPVDVHLDEFRGTGFDFSRYSIARYYALRWPVSPRLWEPWLEVKPSERFKDCILVNRTRRYRNPRIDYKFLSGSPNVVFVGLAEELRDSGLSKVPCVTAEHYLELASWIAGARAFIGNQSFCYALAEALKVPRFLEVCAYVPNVVPCGPGPAREIWEQDLFEGEVSKLLAA